MKAQTAKELSQTWMSTFSAILHSLYYQLIPSFNCPASAALASTSASWASGSWASLPPRLALCRRHYSTGTGRLSGTGISLPCTSFWSSNLPLSVTGPTRCLVSYLGWHTGVEVSATPTPSDPGPFTYSSWMTWRVVSHVTLEISLHGAVSNDTSGEIWAILP